MIRALLPWVFGVPLGLAGGGLVAAACASLDTEKQAATVEYAALEQACVQRAATRSEADACIAGVRLAICGDGGPLAGPVLHCGDAPTDGGAR